MPTSSSPTTERLPKQNLADPLRTEILNGAQRPGGRIVEGTWAAKGEGDIARQYVNRAMERFAKTAGANWEKRGDVR